MAKKVDGLTGHRKLTKKEIELEICKLNIEEQELRVKIENVGLKRQCLFMKLSELE